MLFRGPSPKRVRAVFAGEAVADSRRAKLLYETGLAPGWYFPLDDVTWTYPDPFADAVPVTGHWSFLGEGVETEVEGKPLPADA